MPPADRHPLHEPFSRPLPLGSIRASGWLARQLQTQAEGLSGHLDTFWPDVADSRWFGGSAEGWERAPYWLDGFLPLAWTLDDDNLKARAANRVEQILERQHDDGWLGPKDANATGTEQRDDYDIWALFLALKVLVQFSEVSEDKRIESAVDRCLRKIDSHIDRWPLFSWGQARWFEALIAIWWLYERRPEQWLITLAVKLRAQGVDWRGFFERWPLTEPIGKRKWSYLSHVVNNAMALREGPLWWRLTGDPADLQSSQRMIELLDEHHGMPTGVFTGDECLHGTDPRQGTELCSVVEYMYSLEWLACTTGSAIWGDRLERIAFNALPATFTPDMWAHQYDQQVNQVFAGRMERPPWNSNGRDANMYGLEPFFGCCTANLSQGWPKLAANLWAQRGEDELIAQVWAPCVVQTRIAGTTIQLEVQTDYPFEDRIRITIRTGMPVVASLHLRIPEWTSNSTVRVEDQDTPVQPGGYHTVRRNWNDGDTLELHLPMTEQIELRAGGGVSVHRGPLMYALRIGEDWQRIHADRPHRELPHADWEVHPTTPWNYALVVDPVSGAPDIRFESTEPGAQPFSPQGSPVRGFARARRVPGWEMQGGITSELPTGDVECEKKLEEVELIPYGATNLRIGVFPTVDS